MPGAITADGMPRFLTSMKAAFQKDPPRWLILVLIAGGTTASSIAATRFFPGADLLSVWTASLGFAAVALTYVLLLRARREEQRRRYEQEVSTRTAEAVGQQIGVQPELVTTTTSAPAFTFGRPLSPSEQANLNDEVAHRVEAAVAELRLVQQAQAETVEERVRAIEAKFPRTPHPRRSTPAPSSFISVTGLASLRSASTASTRSS